MTTNRESLDLAGVPCPRNTAQALLKLEMMDEGEELAIVVDDGEPVDNMLASFAIEPGLKLLSREKVVDRATWLVVVKKVGG